MKKAIAALTALTALLVLCVSLTACTPGQTASGPASQASRTPPPSSSSAVKAPGEEYLPVNLQGLFSKIEDECMYAGVELGELIQIGEADADGIASWSSLGDDMFVSIHANAKTKKVHSLMVTQNDMEKPWVGQLLRDIAAMLTKIFHVNSEEDTLRQKILTPLDLENPSTKARQAIHEGIYYQYFLSEGDETMDESAVLGIEPASHIGITEEDLDVMREASSRAGASASGPSSAAPAGPNPMVSGENFNLTKEDLYAKLQETPPAQNYKPLQKTEKTDVDVKNNTEGFVAFPKKGKGVSVFIDTDKATGQVTQITFLITDQKSNPAVYETQESLLRTVAELLNQRSGPESIEKKVIEKLSATNVTDSGQRRADLDGVTYRYDVMEDFDITNLTIQVQSKF